MLFLLFVAILFLSAAACCHQSKSRLNADTCGLYLAPTLITFFAFHGLVRNKIDSIFNNEIALNSHK